MSKLREVPKIPKEWMNLVRGKVSKGGHGFESVGPNTPIPETETPVETGPGTKRRRKEPSSAATTALKPNSLPSEADGDSMQGACDMILNAIGNTRPISEQDICDDLNLDHIICRVSSYTALLQDLFSDDSITAPDIPIVTKKYEESFMREPADHTERKCVMGDDCECNFIVKGDGFTAVEFLLPNSQPTEHAQMCVLCHRRSVQSLFYDTVYSGIPYKGVIQRYGNICSQEGEYARDAVLVCPPNGPVESFPFPVASHQRNKYSIVTYHGTKFIRQDNMQHQDFCQAPLMVR